MVAQIDKKHAAMIADAMAPARKTSGFAGLRFAQGAAAMRTVAVCHFITKKEVKGKLRVLVHEAGGEPHEAKYVVKAQYVPVGRRSELTAF
jgi:hypothetical protein